ncbi:MAG: hypothetical protein ACUVXG_05265 [Anaerolineae bacterium]
MYELKIKAFGHILEQDLLGQFYEALKGQACDVTDIEIFVPSLKGGWREQCPSVVIFKLVPEIDAPGKKDVEECYGLIRDAMRQLDCRLIYRKEIAYGPTRVGGHR